MKVYLNAEFVDYFSKEYNIDGKIIVSHKVAVLNEDFNSDRDRILNISISADKVEQLQLTNRDVIRKLTGKKLDFFCTAVPIGSGAVKLRVSDITVPDSKKNPIE